MCTYSLPSPKTSHLCSDLPTAISKLSADACNLYLIIVFSHARSCRAFNETGRGAAKSFVTLDFLINLTRLRSHHPFTVTSAPRAPEINEGYVYTRHVQILKVMLPVSKTVSFPSRLYFVKYLIWCLTFAHVPFFSANWKFFFSTALNLNKLNKLKMLSFLKFLLDSITQKFPVLLGLKMVANGISSMRFLYLYLKRT